MRLVHQTVFLVRGVVWARDSSPIAGKQDMFVLEIPIGFNNG